MRKAALQKVEQACKQPDKDAERYSLFFYFSMWVILSFTSYFISFTFFLDHRRTQNHIWLRSRVFSLGSPHFRPRDSLYKNLVLPLTLICQDVLALVEIVTAFKPHMWWDEWRIKKRKEVRGGKGSEFRFLCWYRVAYCILILWDMYNRCR